MPTPDRTTIRVTVDELLAKLESNLVGQPPTPARPFRSIASGVVEPESFARPFAAVAVTRFRPIASADGDRLFKVTVEVRIVADVTDKRPHGVLLDLVAAMEDYMDSIVDTGVVEGASGFDDRDWTIDHPRTTSGARVITALSTQTFVARIERSFHLVPAP